jgi:hypothetical protein
VKNPKISITKNVLQNSKNLERVVLSVNTFVVCVLRLATGKKKLDEFFSNVVIEFFAKNKIRELSG